MPHNDRDHQIRILTPWVMKKRGLSRMDAMLFILRFPPVARRKLLRMKFEDAVGIRRL